MQGWFKRVKEKNCYDHLSRLKIFPIKIHHAFMIRTRNKKQFFNCIYFSLWKSSWNKLIGEMLKYLPLKAEIGEEYSLPLSQGYSVDSNSG